VSYIGNERGQLRPCARICNYRGNGLIRKYERTDRHYRVSVNTLINKSVIWLYHLLVILLMIAVIVYKVSSKWSFLVTPTGGLLVAYPTTSKLVVFLLYLY
jgi:hypothetical protein